MINLHEVKVDDTVIAAYEGKEQEGRVLEVNHEDKQVCVLTADGNEFWYGPDSLFPIPLSEAELIKLKFQKDEAASANGKNVYERGPFRVSIYESGGQPHIDLHYRDENRNIIGKLTVNQLQNHYHQMTNFHLD